MSIQMEVSMRLSISD